MVQGSYCLDIISLNADTDTWQEQLHLVRQRREQRGWQLIALFPQIAERLKGHNPLSNRPAVGVILLFQRPPQEKTKEGANGQKATLLWAMCHQPS
jgi:hypothetical protein